MPTPKRIEWTPQFSVNVRALDEQHKRIFMMLDAINQIVRREKKGHDLIDVLDAMVLYVQEHFRDEERLLKQYDYPEFDEHKQGHKEFLRQTGGFRVRYFEGEEDQELGVELMRYLLRWVKNHIMVQDRAYSAYLNDLGVT